MKAIFGALIGLFFGLWYTERERRIELAAKQSHKDRTLEEMSDAYKKRRVSLREYSDDDIADHIDNVCTQLVQPNMTPLEAERVGLGLSELARSALNWDARKKTEKQLRAQRWIDEIGMEIDDDEDE